MMPQTLTAPPTPEVSRLDRVRAFFEKAGNEMKVRLAMAQRAFALELQWQSARLTPAKEAETAPAARLSAVALDLESREWIGIAEGLSLRGDQTLCLRDGLLEIRVGRETQTAFSNDRVKIDGKVFLLKVFPENRGSLRTERKALV
ncbi:hypothetical protein K2X33_12360 [bacterium]|nr:hypothetical protein [bacterium]